MAKYHINAKGEPGVCQALKNCPFGGEAAHYASAQEAREAYELKMFSESVAKVLYDRKQLKLQRKMLEDFKFGQIKFKAPANLSSDDFGVAIALVDNPRYPEIFGYTPTEARAQGYRLTAGDYLSSSLRLDKETGDIYGVVAVTRTSEFTAKQSSIYRVENYGKDTAKAIAGISKATLEAESNFANLQLEGRYQKRWREAWQSSHTTDFPLERDEKYGLARVTHPNKNPYGSNEFEIVKQLAKQVQANDYHLAGKVQERINNGKLLQSAGYSVKELGEHANG